MKWLLEAGLKGELEAAHASGWTPTATQATQYDAFVSASSGATSRILKVAGDRAEISVKGVMTKAPNMFAMFFGGGNTVYSEIVAAIAQVEQTPTVRRTTMRIDSGGGQFDGLFDALAAMQVAKKPIDVVVDGVAASAAYALASQGSNITAKNQASRVGSVGVVGTFSVNENEVQITSTEAPRKRPDVTTEEGVAMVREELDAMHDIFVEAIATGRKVSVQDVNDNYGRGATLLAAKALKTGMIDAIEKTNSKPARSGGNPQGIKTMDLKELMAQHPDVYAAAVQVGIDQERDRVGAHVIMGEATGAMETACAAIKDGSAMTEVLRATYMTAGMNLRDVNNRQSDDAAAEGADGADEGANDIDAEAEGLAVVDGVASAFGVTIEAE